MSVYKSVSINEVMAFIISRTRLKDSSWYDDMYEWIIECVKLMKLRQLLFQTSKDLTVTNHQVEYPCGLVSLDAVIYKKYRLPLSQNVLDTKRDNLTVFTNREQFYVTAIETTTTENTVTKEVTQITKYPIETYLEYPYHHQEYYKEFSNHIETSFKEGGITMVYTTYPVDECGYLLIPDNIDLKLAIYYYVLNAMIGAGYQGSNVLNFQDTLALWEKHLGRAINQIKQPSPDKMENLKKTITRLVQPLHYHESFLSNPNI